MDDLKQKGTKAFLWDFFGKLAKNGTGFVVTIVLARLLEPSDFGLIAMIMVIIGIAGVFTDIGLGGALIQRRKTHPVHYASVFYFNIFIGLLLSMATYFSAPWISEFYNNTELLSLTEAMSLLFVVSAFGSVQNVRLRKELNFALITKINFSASLVSGAVGIALALYGFGVWSLVAQTFAMGITNNILIWKYSKWRPAIAFSFKALTQLWGYGFRIFLSRLIDNIFTRMDYLIIGKILSPEILGFFQRAKSLNLLVVKYSSGSLMSVLFPVLSQIQNDLPRFRNVISKATGLLSLATFLLLGGLYLVSEELILLLFGEKWLPSAFLFQILALSGFAMPLGSLLVNVLSSRGNSRAFLRLEIYKKLIASVNLANLYFFGLDAFLYGLVLQAVASVAINMVFVSREIQLGFMALARPVCLQAAIAVCSVAITIITVSEINLSYNVLALLLKGSFFAFIFIMINYLLKTKSYFYLVEEAGPVIKRIRFKISKGTA